MMTLWIVLTVLTAGTALLVTFPFLRQEDSGNAKQASSIAVYEDQLEEVERERQMGLIDESEADMARVEIERRILDSGKSEKGTSTGIGHAWQTRALVGICSVVVVGSVGLYAAIGSPHLSASEAPKASMQLAQSHQPASPSGETGKKASPAEVAQNVAKMVKRLEEKVEKNPDDAESLRVLGWSYYNLGRFADSAESYRKASELRKESAILKSLYGEALVSASKGEVTDKARAIFNAALAINPDDVRSRYFSGLAKEQRGDTKGAVNTWIGLYKLAASDTQWAKDLRRRILATAAKVGMDVSDKMTTSTASDAPAAAGANQVVEAAPSGPTEEDIKNAEQISADDRMAMIRGMVDGLAEKLKKSPNNPDGWVQLMRSRVVLKEHDAARTALDDAMKTFADRPQIQARLKDAAQAMGIKAN